MKICPRCHLKYDNQDTNCAQDGSKLEPLPEVKNQVLDSLIGTVLEGRYRIISKIGQGGMGAVYKAEQTRMNRICAIKVIPEDMAQNGDAIERFNREAQMSALINDPHAVTVYDFGETSTGMYFLAMEYVEGETLSSLLKREKIIPLQRTFEIIRQAGQALAAAHNQHIVHRDLKPDNIMIARKDNNDWVKVLDFGIAKLAVGEKGNDLTQTGMVIGTPLYMSPEQLAGEKLDPRSDIYSFSIIAYQLLTGKLPFSGDSAQSIMVKRLTENPLPPSIANPQAGIPPSVEGAIMNALARDRNARTPTIQKFIEQFEQGVRDFVNFRGKTGPTLSPQTNPQGPYPTNPNMGGSPPPGFISTNPTPAMGFAANPGTVGYPPQQQPTNPNAFPNTMPGMPPGQQTPFPNAPGMPTKPNVYPNAPMQGAMGGPSGSQQQAPYPQPPMGVPSGPQPTAYPKGPMTGPSGQPTAYPQPPMGGPSGSQPPYPMQGNLTNRPPSTYNPTQQQGLGPSNPYASPMPLVPGQSPYPTGPTGQQLPVPPKKSNKSFWFFAAIFIVVLLAGSCSMCIVLLNNSSHSRNSAPSNDTTSSDTATVAANSQSESSNETSNETSNESNKAEDHFNKAMDYLDQDNSQSAITEFQEAIALNPNYFEAQEELGVTFYNNKQYNDAATVFVKAYDLAQTNPQLLAFAGYAYQLAGQTQSATETYDRFLQKHADSSFASKIQEIKDGKATPPTQLSLEE